MHAQTIAVQTYLDKLDAEVGTPSKATEADAGPAYQPYSFTPKIPGACSLCTCLDPSFSLILLMMGGCLDFARACHPIVATFPSGLAQEIHPHG